MVQEESGQYLAECGIANDPLPVMTVDLSFLVVVPWNTISVWMETHAFQGNLVPVKPVKHQVAATTI